MKAAMSTFIFFLALVSSIPLANAGSCLGSQVAYYDTWNPDDFDPDTDFVVLRNTGAFKMVFRVSKPGEETSYGTDFELVPLNEAISRFCFVHRDF